MKRGGKSAAPQAREVLQRAARADFVMNLHLILLRQSVASSVSIDDAGIACFNLLATTWLASAQSED